MANTYTVHTLNGDAYTYDACNATDARRQHSAHHDMQLITDIVLQRYVGVAR